MSGWAVDPWFLATILGMGAVTYATRLAGLWLSRGAAPTGRLAVGMQAIPGCLLMGLIAPAIAKGPAEAVAALVTAIVAWRLGRPVPALALGVATVVALRQVL